MTPKTPSSRSSIEPASAVPADPSTLATGIAHHLIKWMSEDAYENFTTWDIAKLIQEGIDAHEQKQPTAEQIGAGLDFATVAGITKRYTASLHGSAARMSAESLCRFCVLNPGTPPAEVYESILPVSRPNYGDILAAANWLLLGLAPEAMEYRPLRAVREWVLSYMGGSEK